MFHVECIQILIREVDWRPWEPTHPRHEGISIQTILHIWTHKQLEKCPKTHQKGHWAWEWLDCICPHWWKQERQTKEKQSSSGHNYMLQMSRKSHCSHSCPKEQSNNQMLLYGQEVENSSDEDEFTFFTVSVLCKQSYLCVNKIRILLEYQSTVDVFCNAKLLKTSENQRPPCRYTATLVSFTPTWLVNCHDMA